MSHSLLMALIGLVLLALRLGTIRSQEAGLLRLYRADAAARFVLLWFAFAVGNMAVGIFYASYSIPYAVQQLMAVFLIPAAVAIAINWWLHR